MICLTMFLLTFLCIICVCVGIETDQNITHVGVFLNKVSSCNYNRYTSNLLCANQEYNTLIQYHNVDKVYMCDYHYCVTFYDEPNRFSCSGYVFKLLGGNMDTYLNPLTPNTKAVEYQVNKENVRKINTVFEGYNVLVDRFEQNVQTGNYNFTSLECRDPYSTCILHQDGSETCFGAIGNTFHGQKASLGLGVVIPCIIATVLYLISFSCLKRYCLGNYCCVLLFVPLFVTVTSYLILFQAERFIVKTDAYLLGSMFGIIFGYVIASSLVKLKSYTRFKKVEDVEETATFNNFELGTSEDEQDDEVSTEIELNSEIAKI